MRPSGRSRWPALVVVMAGLILRTGLVDRHGLWVDEVFSLAMATGHSVEHPASRAEPDLGDYTEAPRPLPPSAYRAYAEHSCPPSGPGRVLRAVLFSDTSPPLYYLGLYFWTIALGTSDAALRLFSVLWAAACFPVLWSLGRQVGGRSTATLALTLFAFSPACIFYSTEGRMYSLLWFFTISTALLTHHLHRRGASPRLLALWTLASAAGMLTHYFFVFPWSAFVAWIFLFPGRTPRSRLIVPIIAAVALVAPWYARLPDSLSSWRVTQDWLTVRPEGFYRLTSIGKLGYSFIAATGVWWSPRRTAVRIGLTGMVTLAVVTAFASAAWRRGRVLVARRTLLTWAWALSAVLGPLLFDLIRHTYTVDVPRYAIAGMPAAHLLIALGMRSTGRRMGPALAALTLLAWSPACVKMYLDNSRHYEPYKEIARKLASRVESEDLLLVHSIPTGVIAMARYLGPECGPERGSGMASWVEALGRRRATEDMPALMRGRNRVFFVRIHHVGQPSPEEDWLRTHAQLAGEIEYPGGVVLVFDPSDGPTPVSAEAEPDRVKARGRSSR